MYDELVKRLREYAKEHCPLDRGSGICGCIDAREAADAIEELSVHYCPHAIRNVHDRGDDSLCRVLGAQPPKEEN